MKVKFLQPVANIEAIHGVKSSHHYLNFHEGQIIKPIGVSDDLFAPELVIITYRGYIFTINRNLVEIHP